MNMKFTLYELTQLQLMNIVDEIVPKHLKFPEIQAQIWYMLFELNIGFEKLK